jgi:hypothetical protein
MKEGRVKVCNFCPTLIEIGMRQQIFVRIPNNISYNIPPCVSYVSRCGQAEGYNRGSTRYWGKRA